MKRHVLAPALAALAMFFFGFLFWGISPLPKHVVKSTADAGAALQALRQHFPKSGTYFVPAWDSPQMEKLMADDPIATVHIRTAGVTGGTAMVLGYVAYFFACAALAALLGWLAPEHQRFGGTVLFSVLVGLIVAIYATLTHPIWYYQPWPFYLLNAFYDVLVWLVGGAVLGLFLKGAGPVPSPTKA
ncbi:MAG: hypothetical protein A3G75_03770 [Verrucomicrobia bacterium RIFCSPLOWO2_12_FULL_64_8]|nr:MAG: hypothetical protein A3G75_03770 [Verrucomicrobia bacterium RIFCSPLOWO2_12_FULL_64_8]